MAGHSDSNRSPRGAVVITGASSGIGEACAIHLDRLGFTVFAGVRRDTDAEALRSKTSTRLTPLLLDVTDAAAIASAGELVDRTTGEDGLAGLVNNAGIVVPGPIEHLDLGELRRQLEVNVIGQVAVTRAFLPALRRARGRVVNIGSIGGRVALPFLGAYNASKFALVALTDSLRLELHDSDIEVSIVEPGSVATAIWGKADASADAVVSGLPVPARELYGDAIASMRATTDAFAARAVPPSRVARAVEQALTARRPKPRYLVGFDARAQALAKWLLPDRLLARLLRWQTGIDGARRDVDSARANADRGARR
jgi:NAD(P)-dependent dehydrogenase (short-subunit alcohol dehydrogenase family)